MCVVCTAFAVAACAWADEAALSRVVIPFEGMVDLKAAKVELTLGREGAGIVVCEIVRPSADRYDFKADVRHVSTSLGDVAALVSGRFELVGPDRLRRELVGEVSTRYTLLNYKPVRDVHIKFALKQRRLTIDPLWFGALSGHGQISLVAPHDMDVSLELLSADLDEFWSMLRGHGIKTPPLSGVMTGALTLKGPWGKPVVNGHLAAYNGRLKNLSYEMIDLRFEGTYPLVHFQDGKVVSSDGPSFKVGGVLDLSDLSRLGTQVRQLKREFIVSDDVSGRTWAFRLNTADGHATRLKSFFSGDADGRNQGEAVIGLEKHIGF
jgi:hypothetical protein